MYTYKRFRTSKSVVIIILVALALAAWGVLGLTGTLLAGGKASFEVVLIQNDPENPERNLMGTNSAGVSVDPISPFSNGTAGWPGLHFSFKGYDDFIEVGGVEVDLIGIGPKIKNGYIVQALVYFRDGEGAEGSTYEGVTDISQQKPSLPAPGGSFTLPIRKWVDVFKPAGKGRGKRDEFAGKVYIGDAVYTRTD